VDPLDPQILDRLRKLLGMLGSDHAGERATAGRMASDLLRDHKLTWTDVVGAEPQGAGRVRIGREPTGHREAAAECLAWPEALTRWEREEFLPSIASRWNLTPRQRQLLNPIIDKVRAYARATGAQST
jgi:hypothetical protein